jgi:predicted PurR-regulated permease PerM
MTLYGCESRLTSDFDENFMSHTKADLAALTFIAKWVAGVLFVAVLYWAKDVFIPLALGLLLSFLLSPVVNRLQRLGMSNLLAIIFTATLAFALLAGGFTLIGRELSNLIGDLPKYKNELVSKARNVAGLTTGVGGQLDELASEVAEAMDSQSKERELKNASLLQRWTDDLFPASAQRDRTKANDGSSSKSPLYVQPVAQEIPLHTWATTAGSVLGPLATAGLVTVFALFMLVHREDLRERFIAVISHNNYVTTTEALDEAGQRISRYLVAQTIVNTSYGFVLAIGLILIGLFMTPDGFFPNAVLWGIIAALLRFVPYAGPVVGAMFPLAISLSVFPGYGVVTAVLALIVVMELLSNNVLEPWLYGASSGISTVAVIVAAVFWGWLWGPVGLLLSTPLTVCLVVMGRYVPGFKFISTLLGEQVAVRSYIRVYQRLLAGDYERARAILLEHVRDHDLGSTCDRVVVPLLRRVRTDATADYLSEGDVNRIFSLMGGMIEAMVDAVDQSQEKSAQAAVALQTSTPTQPSHAEAPSSAADPRHGEDVSLSDKVSPTLPIINGCMTHHFSEGLVLNLLRAAGKSSYSLQSIDEQSLPEDIAQQIVQDNPIAVVLVVIPKGGFAQARYLCKTIREAGYRSPIVVCCLGRFKNFDKLFLAFRRAGATNLTTTFSQTQDKLKSLARLRSERGGSPPQVSVPPTVEATLGEWHITR